MRKLLAYTCILIGTLVSAQQDVQLNRLTVYGGLTRYLGDVDQQWDQVNVEDMGFGALGYQRFLGYGTSIYSQVGFMRLQGNDRTNGNLARGLNFRTELRTIELGFRTYLDNGSWLHYDARFAPFFSIGIGGGYYEVNVDQYNATGGRYHYWADGTVRDLAQNDPNATMAVITGQDGNYETNVTDLATEDGKPGSSTYLFVPAQIGVKLRLSERFSLDLAYGFNWTFTDRLDDISGSYRRSYENADLAYLSNPTNNRGPRGDVDTDDHYHYAAVGIAYSFGRRSHKYRMTPIYLDEVREPAVTKAPLPPPPPPVQKPVVKPPATIPVVDELRVKRLVISELVVDSIIFRGSGEVVKATAPKVTVLKPDTARKDTLRKQLPVVIPDSIAQMSTQDTVAVKRSLVKGVQNPWSVTTVDSSRVKLPVTTLRKDSLGTMKSAVHTDSTKARIVVDSTAKAVAKQTVVVTKQDTIRKVVPPVVRDSIAAPGKVVPPVIRDSTVVPGTVIRTDTVKVTKPVIVPAVVEPKVQPKAAPAVPPVAPDTSTVVPKRAGQVVVPGSVTVVEPPTNTIQQRQPEPVRIDQGTGNVRERITVVQVPAPAPAGSGDGKKIQALEDSLAAMRAEQRRISGMLQRADSTAPDTVVRTRVVQVPEGIGLIGTDRSKQHAEQLNQMLMDRIALMELYLSLQEDNAPDSTQKATQKKVMAIDTQVDALRDSLKLEQKRNGKTLPTKDGVKTREPAARDSSLSNGTKQAINDTIFFRSGSQLISETDIARLKAIASEYNKRGQGHLLVTGHTDRSGKAEFNASLSQERAEMVAKVLREAGIPQASIKVKGLGEKLARFTYNLKERNVVVQMVVGP